MLAILPFDSSLRRRIDAPIVEAPSEGVDVAAVGKPAPGADAPKAPGTGSDPGSVPGTGPGQDPGTKSGQDPAADPNRSGPDQAKQPGDPGNGPGKGPGQNPEAKSAQDSTDDADIIFCKRIGECKGPDVNFETKFSDGYKSKPFEGDDFPGDRALKRFARDRQIEFDDKAKWPRFDISSKNSDDPVSQSYYSNEYNAVLGLARFTKNDKLKNDPEKRVYGAELQYVKMKEIKGDKIGDLAWLGDIKITNPETKAIIQTVNDKKGVRGLDFAEYTPNDESWKDLVETKNANGYFLMLENHHEELTDLKVQKIHVGKGIGNEYNMLLELGRDPAGVGSSSGKRPAEDSPSPPLGAPKQPKIGGS